TGPGPTDAVLLEIAPTEGTAWTAPGGASSALAALGQRPLHATAAGFPDAAARPSGLRDSEQAEGTILPGGQARDALGPCDLDLAVPDDAGLGAGFSGGAVHDAHGRLVGLVARAVAHRQQRRLLVLPIETVVAGAGFASAAAQVGLDPVLEDR